MNITDSVRIKMLEPYISGSDVIITGQENIAAGIRYDEGNMFAPIIILLEQDLPAEALKKAASESGVPLLTNDILAKNLFKYGKHGDMVPELCGREIAAIIAREGKRTGQPAKTETKIPPRLPRPVKIEMGSTLMIFLEGESIIEEGLGHIRKQLSWLFGYPFPSIGLSVNSGLKGGEYRILLKGIEAGRGSVDLDWYKTIDFGLDSKQIHSAAIVAGSAIISHADELVQKRAPDLLGRDEVQVILDRAEKKYPVVTGEVKSFLSLGSIRDILRGLLSEQVSIRHIPVILETLADWITFGPAPNDVVIEQIRQSLKRQICMEYTDDKQTLRVLTLEAKLEQNFADRAMFNDHSLNPAAYSDDWLEAFSPPIWGMMEKGFKPVVLCSPAARSWVKEFTRMKFPNLAVLSYVEIPSDIKVESMGEIALADRLQTARKTDARTRGSQSKGS